MLDALGWKGGDLEAKDDHDPWLDRACSAQGNQNTPVAFALLIPSEKERGQVIRADDVLQGYRATVR